MDIAVNMSIGQTAYSCLAFSQYDTMYRLVISILLDGERWTIPSGATAEIAGTRPDGVIFFLDCEVSAEENVIYKQLEDEMTCAVGNVLCSVMICHNGKKVWAGKLRMLIEPSPYGGRVSE